MKKSIKNSFFLYILLGIFIFLIKNSNSLSAQKESPKSFLITGTMKNLNPGSKLFLEHITPRQMYFIDTSVIDDLGQFSFTGNVPLKSLARIKVENSNNNFLIALDNEKINFIGDIHDMNNYSITGNSESEQIRQFAINMRSGKGTATWIKNYIDTVKSPLLAYLAVNQLKIKDEYFAFEKVANRLVREGKNIIYSGDFKPYVESQSIYKNFSAGFEVPNLIGNSPSGNEYDLSKLGGHLVLIDFWASWCGPCRKENPSVVKAYNKYKEKGFIVFSVSLDQNTNSWKAAIEKDQLNWEYHISDLKGWQSQYSKLYNVSSIPQCFLIDENGKLLAKNLRGEVLLAKLQEIYGF